MLLPNTDDAGLIRKEAFWAWLGLLAICWQSYCSTGNRLLLHSIYLLCLLLSCWDHRVTWKACAGPGNIGPCWLSPYSIQSISSCHQLTSYGVIMGQHNGCHLCSEHDCVWIRSGLLQIERSLRHKSYICDIMHFSDTFHSWPC